ncbi:MAG: tRNA preQ1(34) S-adenosylmethionine ribosyltransferase-isomerase QueA [Actinomycetota bacterium]
MHVSDYDYELPADRIAQTPVEPRDLARLLVDRGLGRYDHRRVRDLPEYLEPGDLVVVNDTKVLPARLNLQRSTGGAVEVLLLEPIDENSRRWEALVRPGGRLRDGEFLRHLGSGSEVVFCGRRGNGDSFEVELCHDGDALGFIERIGKLPLPPYVTEDVDDMDRYQTVYARRPASTAAPTAGLHLTQDLIQTMRNQGVEFASVELVVGVDTFRPIQTEDPREHEIHSEFYSVPESTLERAEKADRVVAIGTTAVRSLESVATFGELSGRTKLFIHGEYEWKIVDLLLTNFHMPRTTLLLLVDAFTSGGWRDIYATALAHEYRFLSFGDAMLLERRG